MKPYSILHPAVSLSICLCLPITGEQQELKKQILLTYVTVVTYTVVLHFFWKLPSLIE